MPVPDGSKGFAVRKESSTNDVVAAYPMAHAANDPGRLYTGTPLIRVGATGNLVTRPNVASGLITDTKLIGFSAFSLDPDPDLTVEFPQMSPVRLTPGSTDLLASVYVAKVENIFTIRLRNTITATQSLVGVSCNLREEDADQFVVDTAAVANPLVTIISIHPSDVGRTGGRVAVIIQAARSSWITP